MRVENIGDHFDNENPGVADEGYTFDLYEFARGLFIDVNLQDGILAVINIQELALSGN